MLCSKQLLLVPPLSSRLASHVQQGSHTLALMLMSLPLLLLLLMLMAMFLMKTALKLCSTVTTLTRLVMPQPPCVQTPTAAMCHGCRAQTTTRSTC
jgi:hypothetical protein